MPASSVEISPPRKSMSHFDFREALSAPEQTVLNGHGDIAALAPDFPAANRRELPGSVLGFNRPSWANVIFVRVASMGALFCAFYFFNGAQVLRAAAAWPGEFLYPRPASADAEQPNPVDHFNRTASDSRKSKHEPFDRTYFPTLLTQPSTNVGALSPGGFDLSNPSAPPFSSASFPIDQLNFLPPGADSIFQSLYQRALARVPKPVNAIVTHTVGSARRKISTAQRTVTSDVRNLTNRTASPVSTANVNNAARSTVQNTQQIINQTSANANTSLNSVRSQNQMMMSTSHGTGLGNGFG